MLLCSGCILSPQLVSRHVTSRGIFQVERQRRHFLSSFLCHRWVQRILAGRFFTQIVNFQAIGASTIVDRQVCVLRRIVVMQLTIEEVDLE